MRRLTGIRYPRMNAIMPGGFRRAFRAASSRAVLSVGLVIALAAGPLPWAPLEAQEPLVQMAPGGYEDVIGTWQGEIAVGGGMLVTIVFHIDLDEEGSLTASADSPDQGVRGIPVETIRYEEGRLSLEIPSIQVRFEGNPMGEDGIEGTWTQGGAALPLELERVEEVVGPNRPQEPEPPFPYTAEDVRYPNPEAGIHLAGTLTLPEGDGPFPAVALISGSGAQNRDSEVFGHRIFLVLADHLSRRGIAVLRSDDRGVGESEGVFEEATTRDFAGDAAAAVAYLRRRPEIDRGAVGLVGLSEGGLIAPMVAAESDEVAFIVLMAGPGLTGEEILYLQADLISRAMDMPEEQRRANRLLQERMFPVIKEEEDVERRRARIREMLEELLDGLSESERQAMGVTPETREGWITSQVNTAGGPWFRFFLVHDPRPVLRQVEVPVLALNGERDLQVPPDENLSAIEAALREGGNPDFTVRELAGLNHLFQTATTGAPMEYAQIEETMSPEAMDVVVRWILARTGRDSSQPARSSEGGSGPGPEPQDP